MTQAPAKIHWHRQSNCIELVYSKSSARLDAEFLRVHSTSAEVKGHGPDQAVLVHGKIHVKIKKIEAVGNYGIKVSFDDGHDTGIYTWSYLHDLCKNQATLWQQYLEALNREGKSRDPHTNVVRFPPSFE